MACILVVDDEDVIQELVQDILEDAGYDVLTASDGDQALAQYKKKSVDVVLTDLIMPVKDGGETILELRKINPDIKIIIMSGGGQISGEDHIQLLEGLDIQHAIVKPIDRDQLLKVIAELIE